MAEKLAPIFYGKIEDGKLLLEDRNLFDSYVRGLFGKVQLVIKELRKKRTTGKIHEISNQNGYFWGVVIPILCESFGYTPDEMNLAIKVKFLRIGGTDDLPKVRSTSDLNKGEWEELMGKIRTWASSDYNIYIPEPYEVDYPRNE